MDGSNAAALLNTLWSLDRMQLLVVAALPLVFAITLHEVAHGWVARLRGDRTAEMLGRLTLNPIKHIDPLGTVVVPALMLLTAGFIFGWAKPVPVTVENLRGKRRDMAVVALAGPVSNLVQAVFWALLMLVGQLVFDMAPGVGRFLFYSGIAGVLLNVVLAVLNLLPIPPLDGGRVVSALLPGRLSWQYDRIEPYGVWIVLGLLLLGLLGAVLWPAVLFVTGLYFGVVT
jgi:Zn-dependent protease